MSWPQLAFSSCWPPVDGSRSSPDPDRNCGVKSVGCPGTLYSYGPRCADGGERKLPCGGGDGAAHSTVVASQGLAPTGWPCLMLRKKLMMKGIWASARPQAENDMNLFQCSTG